MADQQQHTRLVEVVVVVTGRVVVHATEADDTDTIAQRALDAAGRYRLDAVDDIDWSEMATVSPVALEEGRAWP